MRGGSPGSGAADVTPTRAGAGAPASPGRRQGESERGAAAGASALGPNAAAVRLDDPLRDGEPEAVARRRAPSRRGVLAEQVRQPFGRHPAPLVRDRDGDVRLLADSGDVEGVDSGRGAQRHGAGRAAGQVDPREKASRPRTREVSTTGRASVQMALRVALTNAERQHGYRERRAAGVQPAPAARGRRAGGDARAGNFPPHSREPADEHGPKGDDARMRIMPNTIVAIP